MTNVWCFFLFLFSNNSDILKPDHMNHLASVLATIVSTDLVKDGPNLNERVVSILRQVDHFIIKFYYSFLFYRSVLFSVLYCFFVKCFLFVNSYDSWTACSCQSRFPQHPRTQSLPKSSHCPQLKFWHYSNKYTRTLAPIHCQAASIVYTST